MIADRLARLRKDDGVGVVELLVVTTIMGIIASITVGAIIQSFSQQRTQLAYVSTLNSVKVAFERTTRELRAADPLVAASPHAITVRIRRAGTCRDMAFELQNVSGAGRLVTRDPVGAAARTVTGGLLPPGAQATFVYQDETGAAVAAPLGTPLPAALTESQVRAVRTITFSISATVPNGPAILFRDTILLRNRGGRPC